MSLRAQGNEPHSLRRTSAWSALLISLGVTSLSASFTWGCGRPVVPDPKIAAQAYADAIERGDADALYEMLDAESRRALSRKEVQRLLKESKAELVARAKGLKSKSASTSAEATLRFQDGEMSSLALEDGQFKIQGACALPSGARTPTEALAELRAVLARRSYAGLMQVLSADSRAALDERLRSLVEALREPDALEISTTGDSAVVEVPGGHRVELRREDGLWKVRDFE